MASEREEGNTGNGRSRDPQRGIVMVLFAMASVVVLLVIGLAVDLGIAHVILGKLSKAVDAGALAGARHASAGLPTVKGIVQRTAAANFGSGEGGSAMASYDVKLDSPGDDTYRVSVSGATVSPTFFAKLMQRDRIDVRANAEAMRYPLDLSLVLDLSYSLEANNVFDDMQASSKKFLEHFDDSIDQLGIVAYSTWAWQAMTIRKNFKATGQALIDSFQPIIWTNIEEGLRLGKAQVDAAPKREKALKVVVLFTDGRPTAFADVFRMDGPSQDCATADDVSTVTSPDSDGDGTPDCFGGAVAGSGLWRADNGMKVIGFNAGQPVLASHGSGQSSPNHRLPGGLATTSNNIRDIGVVQSEEWANRIRAAGYTVYSIGLGDPNANDPQDQPDLDFLRRLANENGIVNANQPSGEMIFAPSAADLDAAFSRLAARILTRLTR